MLPIQITTFISSFSFIYKDNGNGWVTVLCPFCDDATRKSGKISHGHFNISVNFNYCHCFRCDYSNSFSKALISLGFNDKESLSLISRNNTNNFQYYINKFNTKNSKIENPILLLEKYYENFKQQNPNRFNEFLKYIDTRCGSIDPINFLLKPFINKDNYLLCGFYNINGQEVTYRFITQHPKFRYFIPPNKVKPYYFFQDIYEINNYKEITICEGAFDLINLYRYNTMIKNSFYIAIGGKQFRKILKELITNYLLIGNYTFNIVLDNDLNFKPSKLISSCKDIVQQLNPYCKVNFFIPSLSKDVSDLMYLEKI